VAPYSLEATFDGGDTVSVRIGTGKPARHPWTGSDPLVCGPVRVRLYAFDLETEALAKIGPRVDVRAWLREWSGVSVYRDGFRVWPYGEPHDDWLRLDQRRVNNPVVKLSNNQVVGFVEIHGDQNPELRDQTNREGLIHNDAFESLHRLILFGMQLLEAERQSLRHPQGKRPDRRLARTGTDAGLSGIPDRLERLSAKAGGEIGVELLRTAKLARSQIGEQEMARRRLLEGYSDLAATGHAASLIGRTVEIGLEDLRRKLASLRSSLGRGTMHELSRLVASIGDFEQAFDSVASTLVRLAAPADASRRRRGMDVAVELEHVRELVRPVLEQAGGRFDIRAPKGTVLRTEMRPEAFAAIVSALVRNSIEWAAVRRQLAITAKVRVHEDDLVVVYSDNGKGILPALEASLFEPMVSGREGGAGMGLTLARHIVVTHGGRIALRSDRRRRGATFEISLPRKRSRAT
jgi:signal transduction histidine kinase